MYSLEELTAILGLIDEPAVAEKDGAIAAMNGAAEKLLGDQRGLGLERLAEGAFPERLEPGMTAAVKLRSGPALLRSSCLGGYMVYRIRPDEPEKRPENEQKLLSDMRSLLMSARMAANRLCENNEDERLDSTLRILQHSHSSLWRLVFNNGLVDSAENGSLACDMIPQDLVIIGRDIVRTTNYFAKRRGVRLEFSSREREVYVKGDNVLLETMVLNLLSNSLESVGEGGSVKLSVSKTDKSGIIGVDDDGAGLAPEQVPEQLRGGDEGRSSGLRLVRDLAKLHGGTLVLGGSPGKGTSARIMLPLLGTEGMVFMSPRAIYSFGGIDVVMSQLSKWLSSEDYDPRLFD